jgi:cold-inducible RNA-binding protein
MTVALFCNPSYKEILKENMSVRLFVGNLPYDTTEAELREHFSAVSPITYLSIPTDRETGRPRNFAFVEFTDRAHADEAIRRFNNQLFKGRPLAINEARARNERPPVGTATRPSFSQPNTTTVAAAAPAPSDKPNRNFGPDAPSQRRSKGKGAPKSERAPKGPMREIVRGQFSSGGDDYDDDDDELNEESFAAHGSGAENEDET